MVNERYGIAISETLHYLKGIRQEDIDKIPNKFMEFLEKNKLKDYKCDFDYTKTLKELNVSDEARGIIATICLNYWCENEEQKERFKKHLNDNEKIFQEELLKKYNPNDLFKKNEINENILNRTKNMQVIEYKERKWYKKIFERLLNIFRKK